MLVLSSEGWRIQWEAVPSGQKSGTLLAWIVGRKETEFREPIDKAIEAERLKRFSNQRRHGLNQPISAYDRGYQMPPTLGTSSRRSYTSARSTSDRFAVRTISGPEVGPRPLPEYIMAPSAPLMDDNVVFRPDRRMLLWTFNRLRFLCPGQHREDLQEEYAQNSSNHNSDSDLARHLLSPYVNKDAHIPCRRRTCIESLGSRGIRPAPIRQPSWS